MLTRNTTLVKHKYLYKTVNTVNIPLSLNRLTGRVLSVNIQLIVLPSTMATCVDKEIVPVVSTQ